MTKWWRKEKGLSARDSKLLREAIVMGRMLHSSLSYGFDSTTVEYLKELQGKSDLYLRAVARTISKQMHGEDTGYIALI